MGIPERCGSCGEPLERGDVHCRGCGEDNAPDSQRHSDAELPDLLDRLGEWSEIKHQIVTNYAHVYTTILSKQPSIRRFIYIDAFAGSGVAVDKRSGEQLPGSASRALDVSPPFHEYHFIEREPRKTQELRRRLGRDDRVHIHEGDANEVLPRDVLPRCRFEDFARGLCLLDPYGLTVDWEVLKTIGAMRSVEIFFNFMVVGANRNVLWKDPTKVPAGRCALMDRVWGDRTWMAAAYQPTVDLFGPQSKKVSGNDAIIGAYRARLQEVAGFKYVPEPIPMKNSRNATVYYLFFASPNATANKVVTDIFRKYRGQ